MRRRQRLRQRLIATLAVGAAGVAVLLGLRVVPKQPLAQHIPQSRVLIAHGGELLRVTLAADEQYRVWTPLDDIAPQLPHAVKLYEDQWFDWHPGINPVALARASWASYMQDDRQGASTLTMQLARRLYSLNTRSVRGKLQQIAAALWLEARYSKRDILETYLNLAPYGGNIEGVGAASLLYFNKAPRDLTLSEALALAVIPQNPNKRLANRKESAADSQTSPLAQAQQRLWARWIERYPHDSARSFDVLNGMRARSGALPFRAPHAVDRVLASAGSEIDNENGKGKLRLSIDLHAQTALEHLLTRYVAQQRGVGMNNAVAMLVDTRTMGVRALVGSANYFDESIDGQVNGSAAKRSPGSTLKPFIYALALDQGVLHPASVLRDTPTAFGPFSPENFDHRFNGPVTAQDALIRSRNVPAVAVAAQLTQPSLYQFLQNSGVSRLAGEQHYGLALALGGGELTMEELVELYAMLANQGELQRVRYRAPLQTTAQATTATQASGPRLLSAEAAYITLDMLRATPRPDTGRPAAPAVAWKTGTSWGFRDAWTIGVFDDHVLAVWIGNFDGAANPAFVGVQAAAPLFFRMIDGLRAQGLTRSAPDAPPRGVAKIDVCAASGDLPNAWCPQLAQTWFIPGKSPIKVSTLHRPVFIDAHSGAVQCEPGPQSRVEVYEFWSAEMQRLFRIAGLPRRAPPANSEYSTACSANDIDVADAPRITSPNRATAYVIRANHESPKLELRADSNERAGSLYWFVDHAYVGTARAGDALPWQPARAGAYELRVVDARGRVDSRQVLVSIE